MAVHNAKQLRQQCMKCLRQCMKWGIWRNSKILTYSDMLRYLLGGNPEAVHHFRCSELNISSPMQPITDVDGERGPDLPLHVTCEPGALKIVM